MDPDWNVAKVCYGKLYHHMFMACIMCSQGNNGMLVRRGDIVKLAGPEAKSGMVKVQREDNGDVGFVPFENLLAI